MAQFSMGIGSNEKVEAYLYRLTQQLEYMFSHLSPEDNFDENARLVYVTNGERQTAMELSLEGISLSMVDKDNVVSAINLSKEGVKIQGDKITLEGVITANSDFRITLDGSMEARNGTFQGDISASSITGSTLNGSTVHVGGSGTAGSIIVKDGENNPLGQWTKDGISIKKGSIEGTSITVKDTYGNPIGIFNSDGITINNGNITAPTINSGTINGTNINLGGNGTAGTLTVRDNSGDPIGTWSKTGITLTGRNGAPAIINSGTVNGSTINVGGSGTAGVINVYDGGNNPIGSWTKTGIDIDKGSISGTGITLGGSGTAGSITVYGTTGTTPIGTWNATGLHVYKGEIKGPTIEVGGVNNANGVLTVRDGSGAAVGTWDNRGIIITNGGLSVSNGGSITGGTISGATIEGGSISGVTFSGETFSGGSFTGSVSFDCGDYFSIQNVTDSHDYMFTLGNFQFGYDNNLRDHFFGSNGGMSDFEVTAGGDLYVNEIYPRNSWWHGTSGWWSLTEVCEKLWDEIYDTGGIKDRLDSLEGA